MLSYLKLFLHRKSGNTFRHTMPEYLAHTLFLREFGAHISYTYE